MAGATILPVPKAIDAEAHYYPRRWKRNMFFLYGGLGLIAFQISRFALTQRVSLASLLHEEHQNIHILICCAYVP